MGCVREIPRIKMKPAWDVGEKVPRLKKRKTKKNLHGTCKRKSPHKIKANKGCVRETPQMKIKPTRDV